MPSAGADLYQTVVQLARDDASRAGRRSVGECDVFAPALQRCTCNLLPRVAAQRAHD